MKMHVRGFSSTVYDKKQYRLEILNLPGALVPESDQDISLLGLPSESDWILFGPYSDKTLMRNHLMYTWNRDMGRYGVRCRFVEVFLDKDGNGAIEFGDGTESSGTDYWGVYVLMENIKQGKNRIDIDKVRPWHTTEPEITGGYVLKKDHNKMRCRAAKI